MEDTVANTGVVTAAADEAASQLEKDILYLHPSDHPGMALSSSPLDGTNFLPWSGAIYASLGAKLKLGFIDGSFPRPAPGSATYEQWRRVDLMREITSVTQGNLSITDYFTKVRKLWDEVACLALTPHCVCGGYTFDVNNAVSHLIASQHVMQFLMGLHDSYSGERSQILLMDLLPDIHKAFAMILSVENERSAHTAGSNEVAYHLAVKDNKRDQQRRKPFMDNRGLISDNCHKPGHSRDSCFKLYRVPEWYQKLTEQRKKSKGLVANIEDKPEKSDGHENITSMMSELLHIVKNNNNMAVNLVTADYANFVDFDGEFAGNISNLGEDRATREVLAIGTAVKKLYVLQQESCNKNISPTSLSPPNPPSPSDSTHPDPSPPQPIPVDTASPPRRSSRELRSFSEAVKHHEWREAMDNEIWALEQNT
ncbi:UNVERIFIED_CONTAM: hypothetical protein Slati_4261700 [Sesamum latifolium]|uniref:Retrotransposon Copia-like N-terminal domain-containing protein n=1 Tax=Sesamum latifolium TaxID=2727402 RepID=A0AAW2TDU3_9LAMI